MTYPQSADPPGPHNLPASSTYSPRVRVLVLIGPLTPSRVDAILAAAERQPDIHPAALFTDGELRHAYAIQQALGLTATLADVFAAVRTIGRA